VISSALEVGLKEHFPSVSQRLSLIDQNRSSKFSLSAASPSPISYLNTLIQSLTTQFPDLSFQTVFDSSAASSSLSSSASNDVPSDVEMASHVDGVPKGLEVALKGVFRVSILFRSANLSTNSSSISSSSIAELFAIDKIQVRGWSEQLEPFHFSSQQVFIHLSGVLTCAAHYFRQRLHIPSSTQMNKEESRDHQDPLYAFLVWLTHYENLFISACRGCNKRLLLDSDQAKFLPPLFRTFDAGAPYHLQCVPLHS